ncbi:MAG: choice-of-anchor D domain-containing protein [Caldilineaceae bacterium]
MNKTDRSCQQRLDQGRRTSVHLALVIALLLTSFAPLAPMLASSALAADAMAPLAQTTNVLTINVVSARTEPRAFGGTGVNQGAPITEYKYIINEDNTGTTTQRTPADGCSPSSAGYPGSCEWVSIAGVPGSSPIYTQGDQSDFGPGISLPNGRYLISVLADGYKLDGAHFTVPLSGPVTVELQPTPLPDATLRAFVFQDEAITNGAPDAPVEPGLAGFTGSINDYLGQVTTDIYGNPLCTLYKGEDPVTHIFDYSDPEAPQPPDYTPTPIAGTGGRCVSDSEGMLAIPHLGPNRYALTVTPPDGSNWVQTTTLEGNHDWDAWVMEGSTGYDTEFVVAGEPFPAIIFGFVKPKTIAGGGGHHITGVVDAVKAYVPAKGGLGLPGSIWGGLTGIKLDKPIENPWLSLNDLNNGDVAIWVGQGDANGNFDIPNVPDGNYTLTWWDEPQDYILDLVNVTVSGGNVNMGILPLTGWWTRLEGYVFNDINRNGKRDAGEPGMSNFTLTMRKRENSLMDRGATVVTTDANGHYVMENAYPMTQWLVMEAYNDLYYTTGVTYQADNQPTPTTIKGAGVDVSVLPIIGLSGTMDWGVHTYDPTGSTCSPAGSYTNCLDPRNGGIVGTVSYDTTRNELDPRFAAVEDWQPSISNLTVKLYAPVFCGTNPGTPCDPTELYEIAPDGSYAKGKLLNSYLTETWERPTSCTARDVDGNPLVHGADEQSLPTAADADCLEGPLMGVQFGTYATDQGTPDANFGAAVDGNYGFGDGCFDGTLDASDPANPVCNGGSFTALPAGDYLVAVEVPNDALGRPLYKLTREEDINIANGDQFVPQVPPPACAGALHTVDVAGILPDGPNATDNPTILDIGGTPYEGMEKPLCDTKLVSLSNGKSIAPAFNFFTDVPLPGRFWGLIVDDLNFSANPKSLLYGEKAGVPFAPVGIYDYANRLVTTVESDYNGLWDVLLPSTNRISCPTPSGVCANLYRFVGNDPGIPGRLNPNYKPAFRTIAAEFEAFPGLIVPADLAPTQVGVTVQLPGGQVNTVSCALDSATPQLLAISKPYVNTSNNTAGAFTIEGTGFGTTPGQVLLDDTIVLPTTWSDTHLAVTVPASTPIGPHQLSIKAANGQSTINGLTFHVLGSGGFASLPSTAVLANFSQNSNNSLGNGWADDAPNGVFSVSGGVAHVSRPGGNTANTQYASWRSANNATYGANQEAYFTFTQVASAPEQGLILKFSGSNTSLTATGARWIEVTYNQTNASVQIFAKTGNGAPSSPLQTINGVTFSAGDQLGARALADGTILAYKNGIQLAPSTASALGSSTGRIGVRFRGAGTTAASEARFDDFGGGTLTAASYLPTVYEVGPGLTGQNRFNATNNPHAIQQAIDAALGNQADDLVVVYPNQPDLNNPRANPRGAYYENLIITGPVKLQGVGPGGFQGNNFVPGSIIDGGAFGGDTTLADDWRAKIATLVDADGVPLWQGNPNINDGETIYLLALSQTAYGATYKASIDGFDLRGGDQQGFPNNINQIGGGPTGLPANVVTQGGAIFANAYIRNLQITNNVVQNNGGGYGTLRIGTPDLIPASNFNENVRIANNRVIANGGTNLAGGIGLFAGADNYEVAANDICGNFSAEYGGGLSVYGRSPNGKIHHNRIYFNSSYDEGGGIMIAGELPANTTTLSPGTGPVDIYNNLIQANLGNDDGGGIRFLMAGNFPMNVYNNLIVNNVSTHEGGGISLNDAPNVRVYNNTIMKNLTTATAVTSNGLPAPAGLSTSANSDMLQATLPGGSPTFSNPLLFNNIFWDNRAGTRAGTGVTGLDQAGANYWDLGVADAPGLLAPTNSILQVTTGTTPDGSNSNADPAVVMPYDLSVAFNVWRNNPNFVGAILVAVDLPANLLGNYHLTDCPGSPACDLGAASKSSVNAPADDIDGDARPAGAGFDSGADEVVSVVNAPNANVAPTALAFGDVAVGATSTAQLLTLSNTGNATLTGINVAVTGPFATAAGGTCSTTLAATASCTINVVFSPVAAGAATGSVTINADAAVTGSPVALTGNGVAADPTIPALSVLDNFNQGNANTLGGNWQQLVTGGNAGIRRNSNQAFCIDSGVAGLLCTAAAGANAFWGPTEFGATQAAAFTFANTTLNDNALYLKASGTFILGVYANAIRVRYNGGQVIVETTTAGNPTYTTVGTLTGSFANGDTLTAQVDGSGNVFVWKTSGATTTYLGQAAAGGSFTGTGRIGMHLARGARVDNFSGGTVAPALAGIFPQATLLTTFSVANGPLTSNWAGATSPSNFQIKGGQVQAQVDSGAIWWNPSTFGANQEAFVTLTKLGNSNKNTTRWQGLILKVNGGELENANTSAINVRYASTQGVQVRTKAPGQGWILQAQWSNVSFSKGDLLGAQTQADGTVVVYKNGASIGSVNVTSGPNPWPADLAAAGGQIGAMYNFNGGKFDNFGGGEMSQPVTAAASAVESALGQTSEADTLVTELEEGTDVDEDASLDNTLFLPFVADGVTASEQVQTAALPEAAPVVEQTAANPVVANPVITEGLDHAVYLPLVASE